MAHMWTIGVRREHPDAVWGAGEHVVLAHRASGDFGGVVRWTVDAIGWPQTIPMTHRPEEAPLLREQRASSGGGSGEKVSHARREERLDERYR